MMYPRKRFLSWRVAVPIALANLLSGLLTACDVGPDYHRPDIAAPAHWSNGETASGGVAGVKIAPDWWRQFGNEDLDRLIAEAHAHNPDLAAAVARLRQANAQALIAGAPLLPSLSAGADGQRTRERPAYHVGTNSYSASFTAAYEFDFWRQNANLAEAAGFAAKASAWDRETARITLETSLANSFFALLSLQDRVALSKADLAAAENVLEAYRARLAVGAASQLDVAQQENIVATQRALLPQLELQRRQTIDTIAVLAGSPPDSFAAASAGLTGTLDKVTLPDIRPGLPSALLARRPDLQSAEARLIAANRNAKAATAALFPTITLTAQGGGISNALENLFKPSGAFYLLKGAIAQPLFKGGVLEGGVELTEGQSDEQAALYRKAVIAAFADVEDALAGIAWNAARERAQFEAVATARNAFEIALARLNSGTIDILTLLNTQRSLFEAQDQLAQARLAHALSVVGLVKALGGGWQGAEES